MSTIAQKFRAHRVVARRNRAIQSALAASSSQAMRDELLTIANRDF